MIVGICDIFELKLSELMLKGKDLLLKANAVRLLFLLFGFQGGYALVGFGKRILREDMVGIIILEEFFFSGLMHCSNYLFEFVQVP